MEKYDLLDLLFDESDQMINDSTDQNETRLDPVTIVSSDTNLLIHNDTIRKSNICDNELLKIWQDIITAQKMIWQNNNNTNNLYNIGHISLEAGPIKNVTDPINMFCFDLNKKQKRAYFLMCNHHQRNQVTNMNKLSAGETEKSKVIQAIKSYFEYTLQHETLLILASTENVAVNINGHTIHSTCNEISMVDQTLLAEFHNFLKKIKGTDSLAHLLELVRWVAQNDIDHDSQAVFEKDKFYSVGGKIIPGFYCGNKRAKMTVSTSTHLTILNKVVKSNKCPLKVSLVEVPQDMPNEINDETVINTLVTDYSGQEHNFIIRVVFSSHNLRLMHLKDIIRPQESLIFVVGQMEIIDNEFYVYAKDVNFVNTRFVARKRFFDSSLSWDSLVPKNSVWTKLLAAHRNIVENSRGKLEERIPVSSSGPVNESGLGLTDCSLLEKRSHVDNFDDFTGDNLADFRHTDHESITKEGYESANYNQEKTEGLVVSGENKRKNLRSKGKERVKRSSSDLVNESRSGLTDCFLPEKCSHVDNFDDFTGENLADLGHMDHESFTKECDESTDFNQEKTEGLVVSSDNKRKNLRSKGKDKECVKRSLRSNSGSCTSNFVNVK
ncbi:hypothetical protein Glove_232g139 [Diversispora epigaea]|uniref:Uncharacterized protein n=1 Tax=Diversispora epigaea TaxID=1348612 RepID=A0A397IC43_9GLOM|nr:hypothetical protein Glove_232g139 [Diversispora epigaea]